MSFVLFAALALLAPTPARAAAVDLHVHLLMDSSLPGFFRGRPSGEATGVTDRKSRLVNQVSLKDMEAADVRLAAATLYAPAVLSHLRGGYHRSLLKQIDALERWAAKDPRVAIVRTPDEARAVLDSKEWRLGLIIAVEGAGGADTQEKLERLWDRGLRLLTIAHFVDTRWAGAATVAYWPRSSCVPGGKADARRNPVGLTKTGEALVDFAVKKGLLLDLAHASDQAVRDLAARHPDLPLLFTHQFARELTPCELASPPELLREVRRSKGMVGLHFGADYMGPSTADILRHARALSREAGPEALALGSDYNGMIRRVEGSPDSAGYASVLKELRSAGIPADRSAEAFVDMWKRSISAARSKTPSP